MKYLWCYIFTILILGLLSCKKEEEVKKTPIIISEELASPTLVYPVNDTVPYLSAINFKWNKVIGAVKYRISISLDSNFSTFLYQPYIKDTSYILPTIDNIMNEKIYWYVQSIDSVDNFSPINNITSFQFPVYTNAFPTIFNTTLSYEISDLDNNIPSISFSKIRNAISYEIYGSHFPDFIQPTNLDSIDFIFRKNFKDTINSLTYTNTIAHLIWNDTLYIKIRAILPKNQYSDWSETISFIVLDDRNAIVGDYMLRHLNFIPQVVDSEIVQLTKVGRYGIFLNSTKSLLPLYYNKFWIDYSSILAFRSFGHNINRRNLKFINSNGKIVFSGYYNYANGSLKISGEKL